MSPSVTLTDAERPAVPDAALSRVADTRHQRPAMQPVVKGDRFGPILDRERVQMRRLRPDTLRPALSARDRMVVGLLTAAWAVAFVAFWVWWLQPEHRVGWLGLIVNTLLLFYLTYLPSYFLIAANRLPRVNPDLPVPDLRVAFIVTKAPSEPWDVARRTLQAMLDQDYPHAYHVWLCDEKPTPETERWCADNKVRISSRFGVEEYHRGEWPRRTKCKEGNVAYFYDHWGYRDYDVVAQLDCDHVPTPGYLAEMVKPFGDPAVGYVAAPSVNDLNTRESWSNRGRIHKEATFHGPAQLGHNGGMAPSCIGSHYAVRTQAIADIGGIGPELAEDFSTSFLLTSAGWQGVFNDRAEAHGEGPPTFSAMITQEFQWSRSLTTVLLQIAPRHLGRMPWALRFRFLYALSFYPMLALTTFFGLLLPAIAAATGAPWVTVNYVEFLIRFGLISVWLLLIVWLLRRRGLLRPADAPLLSWENWLYSFTRWPYIAWGVLSAIRQAVFPRTVVFKVTPKGNGGLEPLPTRLVVPYVMASLVLSGAAIVGELSHLTYGYVFLSILAGLWYAIIAVAVPALHAREVGRAAGTGGIEAVSKTVAPALVLGILTWLPLLFAIAVFPSYVAPLFGYLSPLAGP